MLLIHLALSRLRSAETISRASWLAITIAVAGVALSGCATANAVRRGERAEQRQDYDLAVVEYTRAVRENPDNEHARLALDRAKLRASQDHFQRGRRFAATGKLDQALVELELAADLNPTNGDIENDLRSTRDQLRAKSTTMRDTRTALETLIKEARELPPPGLDLPQDVKMPASLTFSDASSRLVFMAIAKLANMSIGFDPAFREAPVTVDLRNASLAEALRTVANQTRTFFRVTGTRAMLVIPDTPAKRGEYEEEVVQPFYLSNADLKETMDLLRMVLDARRISPMTANSVLTIKDTPEIVAAAGRLLAAIDKARPEVIIDVELLEVDRTRLQEYGLQFASPTSPLIGIDGSVTVKTDESQALTLRALRNLSQSDVLLANLPGLYYRLLKNDTNTRLLANPQLRMSEGIAAQARWGERVPVPQVTFAPIATGGLPQQPTTSFNYQDIGVSIDLTPRLHHDDQVTLMLKLVVQSLSGLGFGGLPTFANREISTMISLRDGETNMLAGLIREDERRIVDGIPGLSDIPAIGRLFAHTKIETTQSDIVLTLTPHIVRRLNVTADDLRAFPVRRDSISPLDPLPPALDLPAPEPAPAAPPPGTVPAAPPGTAPPLTFPPGTVQPPATPPPAR